MDRCTDKSLKEAGFETGAPAVEDYIKEYKNVKVIDNFRTLNSKYGPVNAKPTVVEDGLLVPIIYTHFDNSRKHAEDLLYYMLIRKDILKEVVKLIKEYDDDK